MDCVNAGQYECHGWGDAIYENCEPCLRRYMNDYVRREPCYEVPLFCALDARNMNFVRIIIEDYHQSIFERIGGNTFLYDAVEGGNLDMMTYLIQNGVRVDEMSDSGRTPLWTATASEDVVSTRFLLRHGANPYIMVDGKTIFDQSSREIQDVILEEIGNGGFDIKEPSDD